MPPLPTLHDAAQALNLQPSELGELQGRLDAAVGVVEGLVGPLTPTERVEKRRHDGGPVILLGSLPVLSVQEVRTVPRDGSAAEVYDITRFVWDRSGVVTWLGASRIPAGWVQVSYTAGREDVPADLVEAVLTQTQILWMSQRRGSVARSSMGEAQGAAITPAVRRLEQLLAPHLLPVVAIA